MRSTVTVLSCCLPLLASGVLAARAPGRSARAGRSHRSPRQGPCLSGRDPSERGRHRSRCGAWSTCTRPSRGVSRRDGAAVSQVVARHSCAGRADRERGGPEDHGAGRERALDPGSGGRLCVSCPRRCRCQDDRHRFRLPVAAQRLLRRHRDQPRSAVYRVEQRGAVPGRLFRAPDSGGGRRSSSRPAGSPPPRWSPAAAAARRPPTRVSVSRPSSTARCSRVATPSASSSTRAVLLRCI